MASHCLLDKQRKKALGSFLIQELPPESHTRAALSSCSRVVRIGRMLPLAFSPNRCQGIAMDSVALVATINTPQAAMEIDRVPNTVSWLQIRSELIGDIPADWLRSHFPG